MMNLSVTFVNPINEPFAALRLRDSSVMLIGTTNANGSYVIVDEKYNTATIFRFLLLFCFCLFNRISMPLGTCY